MSIGGTVSGYLGEALAEDLGYTEAFAILMVMSLVPALIYAIFMPETLPSLITAGKENLVSALNENNHQADFQKLESIAEENDRCETPVDHLNHDAPPNSTSYKEFL
jgi:hypothetical protein